MANSDDGFRLFPVLEEQDDFLECSPVESARSVSAECRGLRQAAGAEMRVTRILEGPAAARAEGSLVGSQREQARLADDPLARVFQRCSAETAKGRKEEKLDQPGQPDRRGPRGQAHWARSSSSAFSWQLIHKEVQGMALSRFVPISLWQTWQRPKSP